VYNMPLTRGDGVDTRGVSTTALVCTPLYQWLCHVLT